MRRAITHQVNPRTADKMANPTAFCKSEGFDSIDRGETTTDTLTGRAGLALFSRYLRNLRLLSAIERLFGSEVGEGTADPGSLSPAVLLLSGRDRLFTRSLRRFEGVGGLCWSNRGRSRTDSVLPSDQTAFLRVLPETNLALSTPDPAAVSLAAPGSRPGGRDFGNGLDGLG